jgi:hypothetical protein
MADGQKARKIGIRGQRYFMGSLAYWYTGGERPDPAKWGDDLVQADTGEMVIRSRFASEEVVVNFADPALAMMNPNHAYGTVDDCIGRRCGRVAAHGQLPTSAAGKVLKYRLRAGAEAAG